MDAIKIIFAGMFFGGAAMIFSIALMIFSILIDFLPHHKLVNGFAIKITGFASLMVLFGLSLFLFGLSWLGAYMMAEGLWNLEYRLSFSRHGGGVTIISWYKNPIRFAFQTFMFAAAFIGLQYYSIKTAKDIFKISF